MTIDDLMSLWLQQDGCCALTGRQMTWNKGKILSTSISIDRRDHTRGYTIDNVRLVCHAVNCFRQQMTDDEMLEMAKALVANMNKET